MARIFPTAEIWRSQTNVRAGSGGSAEFKALDNAFLAYSNARTVKGPAGQPMTQEYKELKRAYDAYTAKKASNAGNWHALGTVDRDGNGILKALGDFLSATPKTGISEEEEMAMIKYTFDRTLRLKIALANVRVELKPSSYLESFNATCAKLEEIKKKGLVTYVSHSNSMIEDLKAAAEAQRKKQSSILGSISQPLAELAFQSNSALSKVSKAGDTLTGVIHTAQTPDTNSFEKYIADALQVRQDEIFKQMISSAQQVLGVERYHEIVSLVPLISTLVSGAKVAQRFRDAVIAYQLHNECGEVRRDVVAHGDPNAAFGALEDLLNKDFKRATQAFAEGAVAFAASFDPTLTAPSVVGALTAVAHLLQDMVTFGLNYYQMVAVNKTLKAWAATPLDGDLSIAFGLKSHTKVRDEIKARRAGGAIDVDQFSAAMRQCPLLGCYFISRLPALDLLEIVAADLAYNSQHSFFQMYLDINSARVEKLVESSKSILKASRFQVVQDRAELHNLSASMTRDNVERHKQFNAAREATLNGFAVKHLALQKEREKAHRRLVMESVVVLMLQARKKAEDEAAALLADLTRSANEVEHDRLLARKAAIAKAMQIYENETGGIHRLHTVRNSESTEARAVLKDLIQKAGGNRQALEKLEEVACYLMTVSHQPEEYPALRPLRDASRLKLLLNEHFYKAA
jgi:hypothetical protein